MQKNRCPSIHEQQSSSIVAIHAIIGLAASVQQGSRAGVLAYTYIVPNIGMGNKALIGLNCI